MTQRSLRLQGQAIVEYAILLGVAALAVAGMQLYAKRGIQAGIKMAADRLAPPLPPGSTSVLAHVPVDERAQALGMLHEASSAEDTPINPHQNKGSILDKVSATRAQTIQGVNTRIEAGGRIRKTVLENTITTGAIEVEGHGPGVSFVSVAVMEPEKQ